MHLRANVHYILEDRPKEYRGLIHQRFKIDRKSFGGLIMALIETACETAMDTGLIQTTEELQNELDEAFTYCKGLSVEVYDGT